MPIATFDTDSRAGENNFLPSALTGIANGGSIVIGNTTRSSMKVDAVINTSPATIRTYHLGPGEFTVVTNDTGQNSRNITCYGHLLHTAVAATVPAEYVDANAVQTSVSTGQTGLVVLNLV